MVSIWNVSKDELFVFQRLNGFKKNRIRLSNLNKIFCFEPDAPSGHSPEGKGRVNFYQQRFISNAQGFT
jgi:hypothetical protein